MEAARFEISCSNIFGLDGTMLAFAHRKAAGAGDTYALRRSRLYQPLVRLCALRRGIRPLCPTRLLVIADTITSVNVSQPRIRVLLP